MLHRLARAYIGFFAPVEQDIVWRLLSRSLERFLTSIPAGILFLIYLLGLAVPRLAVWGAFASLLFWAGLVMTAWGFLNAITTQGAADELLLLPASQDDMFARNFGRVFLAAFPLIVINALYTLVVAIHIGTGDAIATGIILAVMMVEVSWTVFWIPITPRYGKIRSAWTVLLYLLALGAVAMGMLGLLLKRLSEQLSLSEAASTVVLLTLLLSMQLVLVGYAYSTAITGYCRAALDRIQERAS